MFTTNGSDVTRHTSAEHIPEVAFFPRFRGKGVIEMQQCPVPRPGPGQLLLRVRANALCGSERSQFHDGSPVTPGHETAGVVVAAGADTRTAVGTPGVVFLMDFCGQCRNCRLGFTNQCAAKRADMGFTHDGGYGPYELIHENIFFPVDPDLPPGDATLLLDIMGTGSHAIARAHLVRRDIESALVAGAGPVGLGLLAMLKIVVDRDLPVVVTDVVQYRLDLAAKLGGLPVDLRQAGLSDGLRRHGFERVDVAFDSSGKAAARQACVEALGQRGVLVCVGHGEDLRLEISRQLIAPERAVLGSEYFPFEELAKNLPRLRRHRAYLRQIITHRYGVNDLQKAFEVFFGGNTGKVVIEQ